MGAMERRHFLKVLGGAGVTTAVGGIGTLVEAQVARGGRGAGRGVAMDVRGLIYYVDGQNRLMWNRHDGRGDGSFRWAEPTNRQVGTGWDVKHVFSGGDGLIYHIDAQNRLLWNRHEGRGRSEERRVGKEC